MTPYIELTRNELTGIVIIAVIVGMLIGFILTVKRSKL